MSSSSKRTAVEALRRKHVIAALKHAETVGEMRASLVAARLGSLTAKRPTIATPPRGKTLEERQRDCDHEWRKVSPFSVGKMCCKCHKSKARKNVKPYDAPLLPPVLKDRPLPPTVATKLHRYLKVKPSLTVRRYELMDIHNVDVYTRVSKDQVRWYKTQERKAGSRLKSYPRWQLLGSITETRWWRVEKFLNKKSTAKLDAAEFRARLFETLFGRPYAKGSYARAYMDKFYKDWTWRTA